jgi:hypothetical protein
MRTLQRVLLALSLALLCGSAGWAQNNQNKENTSASAGGAYDPSPCDDPRIATNEAAQKATAYRDSTPTGEPDPLAAALNSLAQQYDNSNIDKASECLHASGVVFMVPDNLVGQVTVLVGEIEASEPGGASGNTPGNEGSPGQSGGVAGGTAPVSGGTSAGGGSTANGGVTASGTPCEPNYDMSTAAGQAAAMQNAAQTQYACCEYRLAHNPELAPCTPPPAQSTTQPLQATAQNDNPCSAAEGAAWPALQQLESFTAQVANAVRDALVSTTHAMAPQFDMTQSGEGLRYMTTLLTNMGLKYLAAAAPAAIQAIASGKPVQLPNPVLTWTPTAGSAAANIRTLPGRTPASPPPGLRLPTVIADTPRPLQLQESQTSCAPACVKMIVETIMRVTRPESYYQNMANGTNGVCPPGAYQPGTGSGMQWILSLIQQAGINATMQSNQDVGLLQSSVANGYPALVHLGPNANGHSVIVDAVEEDAAKNLWVIGRDPLNMSFVDASGQQFLQDSGFENYFVVDEQDFISAWSGWAIYTKP